jgi:hypothetical protein
VATALKVCTTNGCIICDTDMRASDFVKDVGQKEKEGKIFVCCGRDKCVRIDQITTVTEVRETPEGEDEGEGEGDRGRGQEPQDVEAY